MKCENHKKKITKNNKRVFRSCTKALHRALLESNLVYGAAAWKTEEITETVLITDPPW